MKAAQIDTYGNPYVIHINENALKPVLKPNQLLIAVSAASINAIDWKFREGYLQKIAPVSLPVTLGGDFAGKVVGVSDDVSEFKVGDDVYGQAIILNGGSGSMAEFVCANVTNTALKPHGITYEEASALPLVGVSALQALEEHIKLQKGQKILIHGGAGGIGHIAIQLAKFLGARVITTVGKNDEVFVKTLGADEIIDYTSQKFEDIVADCDGVFDTVGGDVTDKSFQVLKRGGIIVSMTGQPSQALAQEKGVIAIGQMTQTNTLRLNKLTELIDNGSVKVHIDRTFPLEHVQEAFIYQETSHPKGKVVLRITE